jgi:hypothetical protein
LGRINVFKCESQIVLWTLCKVYNCSNQFKVNLYYYVSLVYSTCIGTFTWEGWATSAKYELPWLSYECMHVHVVGNRCRRTRGDMYKSYTYHLKRLCWNVHLQIITTTKTAYEGRGCMLDPSTCSSWPNDIFTKAVTMKTGSTCAYLSLLHG